MPKRTTVYLDPKLHRAIKMKALQVNSSISEIISEALKLALKEDLIDLGAIKDRAYESSRSLEDVLKDLKRDGIL